MNLSALRRFASCALAVALALSPALSAQTHVVSPAQLQKELQAAAGSRQRNMEAVTNFLSTPKAQAALGSAGIDLTQVKASISSLDDQELARLAARSEKAQADFAAGNIDNRDLLLITLGLVALILIIIAVR